MDGIIVDEFVGGDDPVYRVTVLRKELPGEIYNVGANCECQNIEIVKYILSRLDKPGSLVRFVEDRPGHDRRYAMDSSKLRRELGWSPSVSFEDGMNQTISWYIEHEAWWKRIKSGEYITYYEKWYGRR